MKVILKAKRRTEEQGHHLFALHHTMNRQPEQIYRGKHEPTKNASPPQGFNSSLHTLLSPESIDLAWKKFPYPSFP